MIQSLQRAAAILRSFSEAEPELGVVELARRLNLHKSTVSRILKTLQHEGLVGQNPDSGKYRLGVGLISMAGVALGRVDVRGLSQPYLGELVALVNETVNVTILDGGECVIVERAASSNPIQYIGWIGRRMPLHCTASGKVLLAYMSPGERDALLDRPLTRYTANTLVTQKALLESLVAVNAQGFAEVHEEFETGFSAIASPVFNHEGDVVATISVAGPTFRMGPGNVEALVAPLRDTAHKVSAELGYRPS